ncbi:MAG TPA: twin-arginine translocase TatA/TatE family subunit [Solirubrobacteraceae bacterium]|nr:twin-arginine translocase TatA/TatE family subunit [Solirubrobacteraceae bacterium]
MGLENPLHIAIVLIVVLMVFGAKRLPEMGKGLGEGMRGFKSALSGESHPHDTTNTEPDQLTAVEQQPATMPHTSDERTPAPVA